MSSNILILLSNDFDENLRLNKISKTRANFMYTLYADGDIIFTLGWEGKFSNKNISDELKEYLINKFEIPCNSIVSIKESKDTVGDAFFSRLQLQKISFNYQKIKIITSDWHLSRVKEIFTAIIPNKRLEFYGVYTKGENKKKEEVSLKKFKETFHGVNFLNLKSLTERIINKHPLYKK
jgi:uncharacterized SAM-binding protein YcdF (DUF218 family)